MGGGDAVVTNSIFSNTSHSPVWWTRFRRHWSPMHCTIRYPVRVGFGSNPASWTRTVTPRCRRFARGRWSVDGTDYGASTLWSDVPRDLTIVEFVRRHRRPLPRMALLRNDSDALIDMLGYSLSDAVTHAVVPVGPRPGSRRVVRDASFFNVPDAVVQWQSGQLANEGERILLHNSAGMVVDFVQYEPAAPWPIPVAEQGWSGIMIAITTLHPAGNLRR